MMSDRPASLPGLLPITPFSRTVGGRVELPGSKSLTNRALALAALTQQTVTLTGALFSDDTRFMAEALRQLGLTVVEDEAARTLTVGGCGGLWPSREATLYYGNAGTAARFLTALLAVRPDGCYLLDGSPAMRKRPMLGLFDALESIGAATVTYLGQPGHFPVRLATHGFPSGVWPVDASASSQILSALLLAAPLASGSATVQLVGETVSRPFLQMTLATMAQFGQSQPLLSLADAASAAQFRFIPAPYRVAGSTYPIEPDATAASYFLALPWVVGGSLELPGFDRTVLQGDRAFSDIMAHLGLAVTSPTRGEAVATLTQRQATGGDFDFNAISDTFLTLAAIAPLLDTPLTLRGIAHTRHQETDRIAAMATELRKLGQVVTETTDSLTITPDLAAARHASQSAPVNIHTYEDHRVAMSFGILGSYDLHGDGRPWIAIENPACCAKTFPDFFHRLEQLRESSCQST